VFILLLVCSSKEVHPLNREQTSLNVKQAFPALRYCILATVLPNSKSALCKPVSKNQ